MRAVLLGITPLSLATAHILMRRGADVVFIDRDRERIEGHRELVDCGFIHGDGTRPAILREAGPKDTDLLFCLTNNDQANIIASLVGRSLGFPRVVTKIDDQEFEHICIELGLTDTVIPDRYTAGALAALAQGKEALDFSTYFKNEIQLFSFVAGDGDAMAVKALSLPTPCRVMCLYRGEEFILPDADTAIRRGDEVVLVTHARHLDALAERWGAARAGNGTAEKPQ